MPPAIDHRLVQPQPQPRAAPWVDALLLAVIAALIGGVITQARDWVAPLHETVEIDLSPWALPGYALRSLGRGMAAYVVSLVFTLAYGTVAARSVRAARVMMPLLDVLQGLPVLAFLPGVVLALITLFPHSNVGLEMACVLMIFTGQVWNMTFAYYGSIRAIPPMLREVALLNRFSPRKNFVTVELSASVIPLVWNSMLSMASGWFFLSVTEAFTLANHDFRLPGIGSYMSVAHERGDHVAEALAIVAMVLMILATDQLLWRPLVAWSQRFRMEDVSSGPAHRSWVLDLVSRSWFAARLRERARARVAAPAADASAAVTPAPPAPVVDAAAPPSVYRRRVAVVARWTAIAGALGLVAWGVVALSRLLFGVPVAMWGDVATALGFTSLRTLAALVIATAWSIPVGVAIGRRPALARRLQPVVQVLASFPAPMLFAFLTGGLLFLGIDFSWGCVALVLMGTQWYVLFNVIASAATIPQELTAATQAFRLKGFERWRRLYLPAVMPGLTTGLVTAAGGAWNASIVSEYVMYNGRTLVAPGLGSLLTQATTDGDFHRLAAGVFAMSAAIIVINRVVWKRLTALAAGRYSLAT